MKKLRFLFVALVMMTVAATVHAEVKAGSFSITPFVGGYFFENNQDLKDSAIVGLRAGYNFTENLGLEAFASFLTTEINDVSSEPWMDVAGYGIEGLYHFFPDSRIVPFLALGIGGTHYNDTAVTSSEDKLTVDYGAGVKFFLTENIALRADVRHVMPLDNNYNDFLCMVGINFAFGGRGKEIVEAKVEEPPAPVIIVDMDKDSVPDNLDKCPGTPAGVAVDKDGCPLDTDKDGVYDYIDKCPGTPVDVVVDKDGCFQTVVITLNVEFDTAKANIKDKYYDEVKKVADFMKQYPWTNVVIEGHTDNVGDKISNKQLSENRAGNVRKLLIEKFGLEESRITSAGYGPNNPIATNDSEEGRQKNRRVQAFIETVKKK